MNQVFVRAEGIYIVNNENRIDLTLYFMELNGEFINVKKEELYKTASIKHVINFQDLFFNKQVEILQRFLKHLYSYFNVNDKPVIYIETSAVIFKNLKEICDFSDLKVFDNLELVQGYKNILQKSKEKDKEEFQESLYKLIKNQLVNFIMDKYEDELVSLYNGELNRVKFVLMKETYRILNTCNVENKIFQIFIPVIDSNKCIKKINISITSKEFYEMPIIKEIKSGNISINNLYSMKEEFKVSMISPFSFGKSTMINAFLGKEILKTDVRAETAVITKIINIAENKILAKWNKGTTKELAYESDEDLSNKLEMLTSVREDGNTIEEVIITYKNNDLPNLTLVDSPGLFSRYDHHNNISFNALNDSDMIIFLIDPSKIGEKNFSDVIKENIKGLICEKKNFCFVLSKLDLYEQDSERLIKEMYIVLEDINIDYVPVFFVSSYFALKAKMIKEGTLEIDDARKDRSLFVIEDGDIISGKLLKKAHWKPMLEFSKIDNLIKYINNVKEIYKWQM